MTVAKLIKIGLLCAFLSACTGKPFQPPPPMFKMFEKKNATTENVKEEMLMCGFPDIFLGSKPGDTRGDLARRERCMFSRGFKYIDGRQGICGGQAIPNNATSC